MIEICKGCGEELMNIGVALSRYGHGDICSGCGIVEALKGDFISRGSQFDPFYPIELVTNEKGKGKEGE